MEGEAMMSPVRKICVIGLCLLLGTLVNSGSGLAQSAPDASAAHQAPNGQELNGKIETLTRSLEQTQTELARSRAEIEQLRATLGEVLQRMDACATVAPSQDETDSPGRPGT